MSENVENLILEHLRGMRASQERVEHELREIKNRITSVEAGVAGIRRDAAHDNDKIVQQQIGLDQLNERIERIEKRLELVNE
jgi:septal ring factor EnvC (AmiA/AmiB activator)